MEADNTSLAQSSDTITENVTVEESEQSVVEDEQTVEATETVTDSDAGVLFDSDGFFGGSLFSEDAADDFLTGSLFE